MDYNFADDLRAIREILGYTQFEIAEQIGVEQVTISRNELQINCWNECIILLLIKKYN